MRNTKCSLIGSLAIVWIPAACAVQPVSFNAPAAAAVGHHPASVAVADFNRDGAGVKARKGHGPWPELGRRASGGRNASIGTRLPGKRL